MMYSNEDSLRQVVHLLVRVYYQHLNFMSAWLSCDGGRELSSCEAVLRRCGSTLHKVVRQWRTVS